MPANPAKKKPYVWRGPLTASHEFYTHLSHEQREEVFAMLESHGQSREDVYRIEHEVIDAPLLRIFRYRRNSQGNLDWDRGTGRPKDEVSQVPHLAPLPGWWRP